MSQQLDRISEPLRRAGESLSRTAKGLADFIRAMIDYVVAIMPPEMLEAARVQAALKEAPPRIRHLATHSKKRRTRKKNINRALRDYQRRPK